MAMLMTQTLWQPVFMLSVKNNISLPSYAAASLAAEYKMVDFVRLRFGGWFIIQWESYYYICLIVPVLLLK